MRAACLEDVAWHCKTWTPLADNKLCTALVQNVQNMAVGKGYQLCLRSSKSNKATRGLPPWVHVGGALAEVEVSNEQKVTSVTNCSSL